MKKNLLCTFTLFFASAVMAGAVDWTVNFADEGAYKSKWDNATAYSYVITGDLSSSFSPVPSLTPEDFMATWTPKTGSSDGIYARDPFQLGTNDQWTGSVVGDFYTDYSPDSPDINWTGAAYLVLVLVNKQGETMYAYHDGTSIRNGLTIRDPTSSSKYQYLFDDDSNWVIFGDSGVPEPTALALLALGVAGVALRRRKCA